MLTLEEKVKQSERALAAEYLIDYDDLFRQIPNADANDAKSIINTVETWKQCCGVKPEQIRNQIIDLEAQLDVVVEMERERQELERQEYGVLLNLEHLKQNGIQIADDVLRVAEKEFIPLATSSHMALANILRMTIDSLKVQVSSRFYLMLISQTPICMN